MYSQLSETLDGLVTIRAFGTQRESRLPAHHRDVKTTVDLVVVAAALQVVQFT